MTSEPVFPWWKISMGTDNRLTVSLVSQRTFCIVYALGVHQVLTTQWHRDSGEEKYSLVSCLMIWQGYIETELTFPSELCSDHGECDNRICRVPENTLHFQDWNQASGTAPLVILSDITLTPQDHEHNFWYHPPLRPGESRGVDLRGIFTGSDLPKTLFPRNLSAPPAESVYSDTKTAHTILVQTCLSLCQARPVIPQHLKKQQGKGVDLWQKNRQPGLAQHQWRFHGSTTWILPWAHRRISSQTHLALNRTSFCAEQTCLQWISSTWEPPLQQYSWGNWPFAYEAHKDISHHAQMISCEMDLREVDIYSDSLNHERHHTPCSFGW